MVIWLDSNNTSVLIVLKFCELNRSSVIDAARHLTVMIKEIPFAPNLNNGMMGCPADNRFHYPSAIGERTHGAVTCGIYNIMCGTC